MYKRILAVDDCPAILDLYNILLSKDYELATADCGRSALEEIRDHRPDLVLLDIGLPDISGWDIMRVLRSGPEWASLPVVIVTVYGEAEHVSQGWQLDCTFYLNKPIDPDKLKLLVERLLSDAPAEVGAL